MIREIEKWEEKYIKLIFNKTFRFFKWRIRILLNIDNIKLEEEWSKRSKEALNY